MRAPSNHYHTHLRDFHPYHCVIHSVRQIDPEVLASGTAVQCKDCCPPATDNQEWMLKNDPAQGRLHGSEESWNPSSRQRKRALGRFTVLPPSSLNVTLPILKLAMKCGTTFTAERYHSLQRGLAGRPGCPLFCFPVFYIKSRILRFGGTQDPVIGIPQGKGKEDCHYLGPSEASPSLGLCSVQPIAGNQIFSSTSGCSSGLILTGEN